MQHISLTPFGRQPATSGLLAARFQADKAPALPQVDKWAVFNALREARSRLGITDRDLSVLYALLTFLPAKTLEDGAPLVVFPSNAALSDRAHGMAESTLRRHLAALVAAGLICRQDSPNGKRYAARDSAGGLAVAFGFDLRPLLTRADDICRIAAEVTEAAAALRRQREALVLRLRDAAKLLAYGQDAALPGDWAGIEARLLPLRAALRRKMDPAQIGGLLDQAGDILRAISAMLAFPTEESNGTAAHSGRHHTDSNPDSHAFEPCPEKGRAAGPGSLDPEANPQDEPETPLPLYLVLKACPEIEAYAKGNLTRWPEFIATASEVRGMMGISASAWQDACQTMGHGTAAIVVAAMLQRFASIQSPGGYLRALTAKAAEGAFSPGPMVMSLLNTNQRRAA